MKYHIHSTVHATYLMADSAPISKILRIDEIIEFDHDPGEGEIRAAFEKHSAYSRYTLQWMEPIKVSKIQPQIASGLLHKSK